MGRKRNLFNRNDMKRAVRSAQEAGLPVARVEVNQAGTITVIFGQSAEPAASDNPWDEVLHEQGDASSKVHSLVRR